MDKCLLSALTRYMEIVMEEMDLVRKVAPKSASHFATMAKEAILCAEKLHLLEKGWTGVKKLDTAMGLSFGNMKSVQGNPNYCDTISCLKQ